MIRQLMRVYFETKKLPVISGIKETYDLMQKDHQTYPIFIAEDRDEKKTKETIKLGAATHGILYKSAKKIQSFIF